MSQARTLSCRIRPKFAAYSQQRQFVDLVLTSGPRRYETSRVLLARFSRWFMRALEAAPVAPGGTATLELPVDPSGRFQAFLDVLTAGRTDVTAETIGPLLRIAGFYDCPELARIFRHFVDRVVSDRTVLAIIGDFLRFELADDAFRLLPRLAPVALAVLRGARDPFRTADLCRALSARAFAALLRDPALAALPADAKVRAANEFADARGALAPADCDALAGVVAWDPGDAASYQRVVRYRCDWLPARHALPLLAQILERRRKTLAAFQREAAGAERPSAWYAQAWVGALRDARPARSAPVVRVLEFMATLGGRVERVDPFKYGFVRVSQVGRPISRAFDAANIFNEAGYFMARHDRYDAPAVVVDLAPARVAIERVSVDTRPPPPDQPRAIAYPVVPPAPKRLPPAVEFRVADSVADATNPKEAGPHRFSCEIALRGGLVDEFPVHEVAGSVIALSFNAPLPKEKSAPSGDQGPFAGGPVARLNTFDVFGTFLAK
jgi:hypothetical protein